MTALRTRFLPLAITRVDDQHGCVGALRQEGGWVRPEPTLLADVTSPASRYRYFHWTSAALAPSTVPDARPEDRDLVAGEAAPRLEDPLPEAERRDFLRRHLDDDVAQALAGERSLGLVQVELDGFTVRRSTGGRFFLRAQFADASGERYDWIVPDLALVDRVRPDVLDGVLDPRREQALNALFRRLEIYFALGLTKPNDRFPGRFRGCHPLVVGVHTCPPYGDVLDGLGRSEA